jgi:hypothetical protein
MDNISKLGDAAYLLAVEIQDGEWEHIECLQTRPAPDCPEFIEELRKRCPGFSIEQYQHALSVGVQASK